MRRAARKRGRVLKELGPLLKLAPATASRPSKSPNGACQASVDFDPLQVSKDDFRFVRVNASVRANNTELLQRPPPRNDTQRLPNGSPG
jgi:hypothetical protein